jgi:tetratricopeptide (TPR) repeat protein
MIMYMQVLQLLATEYNSQEQYNLALDAYEEQLRHAPSAKQASLYCQMARLYISLEKLDLALGKLQLAAAHMEASESSIRFELLQTKGDVFFRLGRMEESLQVHEQALKEAASINPAETAKLLYTMGRLCIRLRRIRPAISYFSRELEITIQELGIDHLSVSRILHELAKLYDECLGEHKMALMKLNKALSIELAVLQECHYAVTRCANCNPVTHHMCSQHALLQHDVSAQIRETKKCQGRIHFKLGNFEKALKTSFNEKTAGRR